MAKSPNRCGGVVAAFALCALGIAGVATGSSGDELPRRGAIGVMVSAPTDGTGVPISGAIPGTPAAEAGLRDGDVIIELNGAAIRDTGAMGAAKADLRAGDEVRAVVTRDGEVVEVTFEAATTPAPVVAGAPVEFGHVTLGDGARLRTMLSVPADPQTPVPVVFLLQGITCSSIELAGAGPHPIKAQLDAFDGAGFATFRVDKPGTGDSEGGPCSELGFDRELEGYLAAFDALADDPRIDADRVYLYGISMGGIMAPMIARDRAVSGVAVWGTGVNNWMEYLIENHRNQSLLAGQDRVTVEASIPLMVRFAAELCVAGRTPAEMAEADPAFGAMMGIDETVTGYAGRHARFHRELTELDVFGAWAGVDAPVLVMHGEYDWVAPGEDSRLIYETVNALRPGTATHVVHPRADHAFTLHDSLQDSVTNAFDGPWDNEVGKRIVEWLGGL